MDLNYSPDELASATRGLRWMAESNRRTSCAQDGRLPGAFEGRSSALAQDPGQEGLGRARLAKEWGGTD